MINDELYVTRTPYSLCLTPHDSRLITYNFQLMRKLLDLLWVMLVFEQHGEGDRNH